MSWYSSHYPRKTSPRQRWAVARREVARLEKSGRELEPVLIEGRTIARTFWGKAWCDHIETFSDYSNRLPRGRTYARNGSVIDLQLAPGEVRALVSCSSVYEVRIDIEPLAKARWAALVNECSGRIDSIVALLAGELPDAVLARLCDVERGLFPTSRQLKLACSCPDWAGLCKHLAAVLYGVGARLDSEPELFFVLRGVDKLDLVGAAAGDALAGKAAPGDLPADELSDLFGIELDAGSRPAPARVAQPKRKPVRKRQQNKAAARPASRNNDSAELGRTHERLLANLMRAVATLRKPRR